MKEVQNLRPAHAGEKIFIAARETVHFVREDRADDDDLVVIENEPVDLHRHVVHRRGEAVDPDQDVELRGVELAEFLRARGIDTGVHYPEPPHLAAPYAHLGYARGSFPIAEALAEEVLSLPIFPGMTEEQITAVTDSIAAFFQRG